MGGVALVTGFLGFEAGGFFPGSTSVAALGLDAALIIRVGVARHPFEGFRRRSAIPVSALGLLVLWALLSSAWSHAPGRAVLEVNRTLLYLGALVLFSSFVRRDGRLAALAGGVALGSTVVAAAGFLSRTLPHVFPIVAGPANERLSYPVTYWNAMGLLAVVGIMVCLGLSSAERVPRLLRIAAVTVVPMLAATLLLTFSRGAIAAGLAGLTVLFAFCRTRTVLLAVVAGGPPAAFACQAAYAATALTTQSPTGPAAVSQGRHVAVAVGLACAGALVIRAALSRWDCPPARPPSRAGRRRLLTVSAALVLLVAAGSAAVALHVPSQISAQYHRFVADAPLPAGQQLRARLLTPANNGRLAIWRVAVDTWDAQPVHGAGAGTFQVRWNRLSRTGTTVVNAHSVYLETLSDLGVVGLALLLICLIALIGALVTGAAGQGGDRPDRAVAAGLLAAGVCWMLHAGLDWDWQVPAITWWLFAAGGLALARGRHSRPALASPSRTTRLVVMVGIGVAALLPAQVGLSQLHLTRAITALKLGNCNAAVGDALKSASDVAGRAEPYEILAYCDARYGHPDLALTRIQNAINRDPENWEFHYDMALLRGAAGLDPRPQARLARALNPINVLTTGLARTLNTSDRRIWRSRALTAPLLIPGPPRLQLALPQLLIGHRSPGRRGRERDSGSRRPKSRRGQPWISSGAARALVLGA